MKSSDAFRQTIKEFLEKRGSFDPLFAKIITKPGKNIDDCITYILNTVKASGCNGFTDDEVFTIASDYFNTDNVNVGSPPKCDVVVNHVVVLTEEEKLEARKQAIEKLRDETIAKMKAKHTTVKEQTVAGQDKKEKPKQTESTLFPE